MINRGLLMVPDGLWWLASYAIMVHNDFQFAIFFCEVGMLFLVVHNQL